MTVITKPLSGEKKPGDKVPLVLPVNAEGLDAEKGGAGAQRLNERYHYILRNRAARVSSATMLCLLIMALLVMTVGLFGGLYIYKQMSRARLQKWRGWCNVPYLTESPYHSGRIDQNFRDSELNDPLLGMQKLEGAKKDTNFFREEFEIDLTDEKYTKVEVPDFKNGRLGRFIHEFDSNKTAIVDQTGKRCFIMPLDRERILPPKSMYDMIEKMWKGYYSVNTQRVRENMRVVLPAVDDLSELGEYIQQECEDKTTYRLEKATDRVYKRSISSAHELPFTEFAGLYTIDYDIVNLDQIGIQEHH
ncbi:integral membrane protein 2B isoform X2 [Folsomia candida]|uniref:integral membrane protein 2B isoform X2 n=1 Tax=Folsomia candida TaxID=158441 RepID=UPI000B9041E2|nr:integral membrane protein 2B isoform X2 [Folsomia candida]